MFKKLKKLTLSPAILKLETLLYKNIYILIHLILYLQSDFYSKKKKSGLREKKTCQFKYFKEGKKIIKTMGRQ